MILDTSLEQKSRPLQTRTFRKSDQSVRITPDQSKRQNDLLRCAWDSLRSKSAVIAFLNTHNDALGGPPLSLALRSDDGLMSARRLLEEMPLARPLQRTSGDAEPAADIRRSR